ncbi:MAG: hypothetical protein IMZ67_00410 [Acidobacteria bacterium]|nr:hypothetical protein [Acidobacteriota bacterium]
MHTSTGFTTIFLTLLLVSPAFGQTPLSSQVSPGSPAPAPGADERKGGLAVPASERLRVRFDLLAGWAHDGANASLGFEKQGRVGYAVVTLSGRVHRRVRYLASINPVNETEPLPACGEPSFFFPNDPTFLYTAGPSVPCEPKNGNRRVDGYRGIALDVVRQQGPIREAWVELDLTDDLALRFGRTRLPLGFDWEDAGSMSAKDAARIQRINAEASFGAMFVYRWGARGRSRPIVTAQGAGVLGEGNRWWDYDYFYFQDGSLDSNSALTAIGAVTVAPVPQVQLKASVKRGFTGSKVERLPSYWASKRNDNAVIVGAEYAPIRYARVLGEWARYTWGPAASSAEMLGFDTAPIEKTGYWVTAEAWYPVTGDLVVGASVTREEVDRADSLVKYMAAKSLYGVQTGRKDRLMVLRFFADIGPWVRVSVFRTDDSNPYPWLSGMWPVEGPQAFTGRAPDKYGVMVRVRVR